MAFEGYTAVTITAPNGSSSNILTLCQAVDASFPGQCHELVINADKTITGKVNFGDADVSATRFGYQLEQGESRTYRAERSFIPISLFYVWGTAASQTLHVEAIW